jgi:hypothetical protein
MARISGRFGAVEIADSSPVVTLGSITKWTLSKTRNFIDVTCFQDANKVYVPDLPDISGSISFFYSMDAGSPLAGDSEALFEATENPNPVVLRLVPSTNESHYWSGPAYVDLNDITVDVKGAVAGTSNFKASGDWSRV